MSGRPHAFRGAPRALFALLWLATLVASGCTSPSAPSAPPNVVLISIDTLRADHLGAYGYARATSPNVDALAREGALFENAVSPSSWTLPAHASLLTGVSPYVHGAVAPQNRIRDDVPTLAERLRERGYATEAFVNAPFLSSRYGFARGFDRFHEVRGTEASHHQGVLDAIRSERRRPVFFFIHYMDVHTPYQPPPEYNRFASVTSQRDVLARQGIEDGGMLKLLRAVADGEATLTPGDRDVLVDLYDGEILAMDAKLGELVATIREHLSRDTIIIVTSDHGEEFLEHGSLLHGRTLYEEVLHVPLVVAGPGVKPGLRVRSLATLADVPPTILEWANARAAPGMEGGSLAGLAAGREPDELGGEVALHTLASDRSVELRGIRTAHTKAIHDLRNGRRERYDLRADPAEARSLEELPELARAERRLDELRVRESPLARKPDRRSVEALEALGYL